MAILTSEWWAAAAVRCIKTMAQTAVALLGSGCIGVLDADWVGIASATALAGILSLCTSLAGLPEVDGAKDVPEVDIEDLEGE